MREIETAGTELTLFCSLFL
uniref:Uncharacterized protein n=1 Tax=Arundo donax TaxID=35708 RepID=A0A0A9F505_ARUDO